MKVLFAILLALVPLLPQMANAQSEPMAAQVPEAPSGRLERILLRKRLIVGVKSDYAPWGMIDPATNGIIGLEPDLARDIADRLGVELELQSVSASNRLSRVNQGAVDLVIATMGDTEERRLTADLIQPNYYSSGVALYARTDTPYADWGQLRGRPVCLTRGAYFNPTLERNYLVSGQYYDTTRASLLALKQGECVGWAFDDTQLAQLVIDSPDPDYGTRLPSILVAPWALAVAKGEGNRDWGRFVSDMVAEWHRTGRILELQDKWGLSRTAYLEQQADVWTRQGEDGPVCTRGETGQYPEACVARDVLRATQPAVTPPDWVNFVSRTTGLELAVLYDGYERARLIKGVRLTLALSATAMIGALLVGCVFGLIIARLESWGRIGHLLAFPFLAMVTIGRMTPPILQLYIVFFGLGGILANAGQVTPGAFTVAATIFSLYAGSTSAILISHALMQEHETHPSTSFLKLLPRAISRAYDGLVAALVNIVKAAGMASTIAVTELVSSVNQVVSEGGHAMTLMNGLLVFYFFLVLFVLWMFSRLQRLLVREVPS